MKKRLLALMLAILMVVSLTPMEAFAVMVIDPEEPEKSDKLADWLTGGVMEDGVYRLSVDAATGREGYSLFSLGEVPWGTYAEYTVEPGPTMDTETWQEPEVQPWVVPTGKEMDMDIVPETGELVIGIYRIDCLQEGESFYLNLFLGVDEGNYTPCEVRVTVTGREQTYNVSYLGNTLFAEGGVINGVGSGLDLFWAEADMHEIWTYQNGRYLKLFGDYDLLDQMVLNDGIYPEDRSQLWGMWNCDYDQLTTIWWNLSEELYTLLDMYGSWECGEMPSEIGTYTFTVDPDASVGEAGAFESEYGSYNGWSVDIRIYDPQTVTFAPKLARVLLKNAGTEYFDLPGGAAAEPIPYVSGAIYALVGELYIDSVKQNGYQEMEYVFSSFDGQTYEPITLREWEDYNLYPGQYQVSPVSLRIGQDYLQPAGLTPCTFEIEAVELSDYLTGCVVDGNGIWHTEAEAFAGTRDCFTVFSLGAMPWDAYAEITPELGSSTYGQKSANVPAADSGAELADMIIVISEIEELEAGQTVEVHISLGSYDPGFIPCDVEVTVTAVNAEYTLYYDGAHTRPYDQTRDPAMNIGYEPEVWDNLALEDFGLCAELNGRTLFLNAFGDKEIPAGSWPVDSWYLRDPVATARGNFSEELETLITMHGSWKDASGAVLPAAPAAEGEYTFTVDPTGFEGSFGDYTFTRLDVPFAITPAPVVSAYLERTVWTEIGSQETELLPFTGSALAQPLVYDPNAAYRFVMVLTVDGETAEENECEAEIEYLYAYPGGAGAFCPKVFADTDAMMLDAGSYQLAVSGIELGGEFLPFDLTYSFEVEQASLADFLTGGEMQADGYHIPLDAPANVMGFAFDVELGQFPFGAELQQIEDPAAMMIGVASECEPAEGWESEADPLYGSLTAYFDLPFLMGTLTVGNPEQVMAELHTLNNLNYSAVNVIFDLDPVELIYTLSYYGDLRLPLGGNIMVDPYSFDASAPLNGSTTHVIDTQSFYSDMNNMLFGAAWTDASGNPAPSWPPTEEGSYLLRLDPAEADGISLHYYPLTLQMEVYDPNAPCDHVWRVYTMLGDTAYRYCLRCHEAVFFTVKQDPHGDDMLELPEDMAEIVEVVNEDPEETVDIEDMSLEVLMFVPEEGGYVPVALTNIVEDLTDAPITNADGGPVGIEDVEAVYDITAYVNGQRFEGDPDKRITFRLNVGIEMAHELEEGTVQFVHELEDGRVEILQPVWIDTLTGEVLFRVSHFSPFAAVRVQETQYYGRLQLSRMPNGDALVYVYDRLAEGIEAESTNVIVYDAAYPVPLEDYSKIMKAYLNDYPQHFWLKKTYSYAYIGTTLYAYYPQYDAALMAEREHFLQAAEQLIADAGITAGNVNTLTDYEKAIRLHDVIVAHNDYISTAENRYNAYGCIVEGRSVCEGITEAYQYLLQEVGVASHRITGASLNPTTGKSIAHAWNAVRQDGKWYYIDLTWDDQGEDSYDTFYSYFNITETQLRKDHSIDTYYYVLPDCTATDLNYYSLPENSSKKCSTSGAFDEIVRQIKTEHKAFARLLVTDPSNFSSWLENSRANIAKALGLNGYRYSYTSLGGEYHIKFLPYTYATYEVNLPVGTGYHVVVEDGFLNPVVEGGTFRFTVSVSEGYETSDPFVVKANGAVLAASEGTYEISNIGGTQTVAVETVEPEPPKPIVISVAGGAMNADGRTATVKLIAEGTKSAGTSAFTASFDPSAYKLKTKEAMPGVTLSVSGGTITVSWTEERTDLAVLTFEAVGTPAPAKLTLSGQIANATFVSGEIGLTCALQTPQATLSGGNLTVRLTDARICTPKPTESAKLLLVMNSGDKLLSAMAPAEVLSFNGSGTAETTIAVECGSADSIRIFAVDAAGALRPLANEANIPTT